MAYENLLNKNGTLTSRYFPSFKDLPLEYAIVDNDPRLTGESYYFMVEITRGETFIRFGIFGLDKDGKEIHIVFYPENEDEKNFDWSIFKPGKTLCCKNAEHRQFLDCTHGVRIEDLTSVSVLKLGLDDSRRLLQQLCSKKSCWGCGKSEGKLKNCGQCNKGKYCSRDCQADHWVKIHKRDCKNISDILPLLETVSEISEPFLQVLA